MTTLFRKKYFFLLKWILSVTECFCTGFATSGVRLTSWEGRTMISLLYASQLLAWRSRNLYLQESPACKTAHPAVPSEHVLSQECPKYFLSSQSSPVPLLPIPLMFSAVSLGAPAHKHSWCVKAPDATCLPPLQCQEKAEIWEINLFPVAPMAQRDSHWGTGQWAWNWVEKHRIYPKLVNLFFRHFPKSHLCSFFWNYTFAFKDCKPLLITA